MSGFTDRLRRMLLLAAAAAVCAFLLAGCAGRDVVFTSGLPEDEVFLIRNGDSTIIASLPETLIYVESIRSEISEALWSDELYYEDETRAMALSRLSRVKVMNLMALEYGISLEPEEESAADSMATAWDSSWNRFRISWSPASSSFRILMATIRLSRWSFAL